MKFQSAPHFSSEANTGAGSQSGKAEKFQSAPHFSSEANDSTGKSAITRWSFNPRLTSAARRPKPPNNRVNDDEVSIRASLQQRGEPGARQHFYWSTRFQSAPHFSSEANSIDLWFTSSNVTFQSAPHFSSEANATDRREVFLATCFNPRLTSAARRTHSMSFLFNCQRSFNPRLTSAARRTPNPLHLSNCPEEFQSAPHFRSEANWRVRSKVRPIRGFNPRLTSAARRTNCRHRQRRILEFQSAPHFSSEANSRLRVGSIRSSNVSIRASLQQRGELAQAALLPGLSCFNPRLTSAARRTSQSALKISLS